MPSVGFRIEDGEVVARFLFDRGDFALRTGRVKPKPFLPLEDGTTSVFRTNGLDEREVWSLAVPRRGREAMARGAVTCRRVREVGLEVMADEPPPRHANIVNWPAKDARLSLAQALVADAVLHIRPSDGSPVDTRLSFEPAPGGA